jgi:hypothetical protein
MAGARAPVHQDARAIALGGFAADNYWSSSENNSNNGWNQNFSTGNQNDNNKNNTNRVRAARVFVRARAGRTAGGITAARSASLLGRSPLAA